MRVIDKIIVHCTDTPPGMDVGVKIISEWHKERKFPPYISADGPVYCGYHRVVRINGDLEFARPDMAVGCHVAGYNSKSLGIVYVGRDGANDRQLQVLVDQCVNWVQAHGIEPSEIYGHSQFNKGKTCPNLDMDDFREAVLIELNRRENGTS